MWQEKLSAGHLSSRGVLLPSIFHLAAEALSAGLNFFLDLLSPFTISSLRQLSALQTSSLLFVSTQHTHPWSSFLAIFTPTMFKQLAVSSWDFLHPIRTLLPRGSVEQGGPASLAFPENFIRNSIPGASLVAPQEKIWPPRDCQKSLLQHHNSKASIL